MTQKQAIEAVKTGEGRVDLVTDVSPLETLTIAQSRFATVAKHRGTLATLFGQFNMRKVGSPWRDVRLRRAVNLAINREDLIAYAAKGNGTILPALLAPGSMGYDPDLARYPFDPNQAHELLREAGYPNGLQVRLIAPEGRDVEATVVSKMLGQIGLAVDQQILDAATYARKVYLSHLDAPAEQQSWDIALTWWDDLINFPLFEYYITFALDGVSDWVEEQPELRELSRAALGTVDPARQQTLIREMERHVRDQAYFLFLYSPIMLYAVNKAVVFVPYASSILYLGDSSVTDQHWSVRKLGMRK